MVSPGDAERDYPAYALIQVRKLVRARKLLFAGSKVENDAANLGYTLADVCLCLERLHEDHFCKSIKYPDRKFWMDVYSCTYNKDEHTDRLYIKLALKDGFINVHLHSFHQA
jgi:hypothetical protein